MRLLIIAVAVVFVAAAIAIVVFEPFSQKTLVENGDAVAQTAGNRGTATFTWTYLGLEQDSIPYTSIRATASYEDGTSDTRIIDTVEGSCNAYEEADTDTYARSTMVICYYAGLGRYYKIIEDENGYLVQRRIFEEASPEYDPPQQPYETVERFSH